MNGHKDGRVRIRFSTLDHKVIETAAMISGMTFPEFVNLAAIEKARRVIAREANKADG